MNMIFVSGPALFSLSWRMICDSLSGLKILLLFDFFYIHILV